MNLAYHDVRAPPKDYNRLIVIVVLLPSRIRMCVPVLLTFFRAPPKDYNRVIVIAHALAQLRTITFLEPSSHGVVCNEHGVFLAVRCPVNDCSLELECCASLRCDHSSASSLNL